MKKKTLIKTLILILSVTTILNQNSIRLSDNLNKKIEKLSLQFNQMKNQSENQSISEIDSKKIKQLGIQISELSEFTKTEEDYRKELEECIDGSRTGLHDTKREQEIEYDEDRQRFIEKMESKLDRIESEMKQNDIEQERNPDIKLLKGSESPSKNLIIQLFDRSDVDN